MQFYLCLVIQMEMELVSILALVATAILSIISLYFRSKYRIIKEFARIFVDVVSRLLEIIEDDKITEDEAIELIEKINLIIVEARKLIGQISK